MPIRDAERFKDKIEFSLDSRQIFFLFFGGAVLACLVFVLGVMVGKRLESRDQIARRASTSAVVDPLAALDELAADEQQQDELAFSTALGQRLGGSAGKGAGDKAADKAAADKVAADKAAADKAAADKAAADKAAVDKATADKVAADKATADKATADKVTADKAQAKSDDGQKKKPRFTLQLSSFQDKAEADAFVAKLKGAGYSPRMSTTEVPEKGTFYRVRIGEYVDQEAALEAKREFEKAQHVIAYVTRL